MRESAQVNPNLLLKAPISIGSSAFAAAIRALSVFATFELLLVSRVMKTAIVLIFSLGLTAGGMFTGCSNGSSSDPAAEAASDGGAEPEAAAEPEADAEDASAPISTEPEPEEECVDEYPYDDGYSCEEQAAWDKCDEPWLAGYCQLSCDRCGEVIDEGPDLAGARDVFTEYTEKEPLAATPPMGWNSWNRFACEIDEELIKQTADAMVESGMKDAGYEYVNIDDCWHADERDADGKLVADPERFPSGIKALSDYVHERGLKLGIYSDRGYTTCGGFPGSYDNEVLDAQTFAEWGVDYLKYVNCDVPNGREQGAEMEEDYRIMGEALRQSGRDIVYSVCAWWYHPWMPEVGHLWRTTTDIKDIWTDDHQSVTRLLNWSGGTTERYGAFTEDDLSSAPYPEPGLAEVAGPHAWNDPDMLEVGNGGMTNVEYRSHFSLWAIMAAPLIAGNDLRNMSDETVEILTHPGIIAINQDPMGAQGRPISESTTLEVWSKPLQGGDTHALVLFNRTEEEAEINVDWADVGLAGDEAHVTDVWAGDDLGMLSGGYSASVPSHGVVVLRVCTDCGSEASSCDGGVCAAGDAGSDANTCVSDAGCNETSEPTDAPAACDAGSCADAGAPDAAP